jgi:glycosyltransferase involved in cell wall biosynthesis
MAHPETFSMLYVAREKHPCYRVDLTELFSAGIAGRGHHIDWVMRSAEPGVFRTEELGPRERMFVGAAGTGKGVLGKAWNQILGWVHDIRVWRMVRSGEYDFIQVRDKPLAALIGLLAARTRNIPFIYWMSFPFPEADRYRVSAVGDTLTVWHRWFYRLRGYLTDWLLYRGILPRADHIFVQSDQMKRDVSARGISKDKLTAVPMGIALAQISTDAIEATHDARLQGRLPIVYVGTLARARRMDFLIEVFRRVLDRIPQAILVLVGDGREGDLQFLRDQASRLGLEQHVVFTGFVPREEAWGYIRAARVCVSPFRPSPILDSTSPTKVVEYLAWGRPVVANDHPDQAKVLAESGAGITVPYETEAFANAILELLVDEHRAEAMGKSGPAYVRQQRSYEQLSGALEQQYLRLLGRRTVAEMNRQAT